MTFVIFMACNFLHEVEALFSEWGGQNAISVLTWYLKKYNLVKVKGESLLARFEFFLTWCLMRSNLGSFHTYKWIARLD